MHEAMDVPLHHCTKNIQGGEAICKAGSDPFQWKHHDQFEKTELTKNKKALR